MAEYRSRPDGSLEKIRVEAVIEPRVCQNETCGKTFMLQEGRAQTSQRRTKGVLYCSAKCAKAQVQRNYRARQRAKKAMELTQQALARL